MLSMHSDYELWPLVCRPVFLVPLLPVSHCSVADTGAEKKELCLSLGAEKWIDFRETKDLVKDIKNATGGEGPHAALVSAASVSLFGLTNEYYGSRIEPLCIGRCIRAGGRLSPPWRFPPCRRPPWTSPDQCVRFLDGGQKYQHHWVLCWVRIHGSLYSEVQSRTLIIQQPPRRA